VFAETKPWGNWVALMLGMEFGTIFLLKRRFQHSRSSTLLVYSQDTRPDLHGYRDTLSYTPLAYLPRADTLKTAQFHKNHDIIVEGNRSPEFYRVNLVISYTFIARLSTIFSGFLRRANALLCP
jgi:hypothetical protein